MSVDASPLLMRVAELLERHGLEAILIGNSAAALHGAPVTTIDLDFLFRKTPANLKKLEAIAGELEAVILRPYYFSTALRAGPVSGLFRVSRDRDGLQLDFMTVIDGIRSFEGLRKRAVAVRFGEASLPVAALADIIKSKKAAGRLQDLAVLQLLEKTLEEAPPDPKSPAPGSQTRE